MKLPVISSDATTVRINYMGETQTIPIAAARFETDATAQSGALPSNGSVSSVAPQKQAPTPPAQQQPTVSLQFGFDSRMQGGDITMRELESLLSRHCTAAVDFSGYGMNIFNGVCYLMDARQAASVLGLRGIPSRVQLATPGFPKNSLSYIAYDGMFEAQYNRLYLVTDVANKVVGIQLVDEHPKGSDRPDDSDRWHTYNFINTRVRASDASRIAIKSDRQGDVIRIETRMFQPVRERLGRSFVNRYQELEKTKLLIPIPFARIILHCTQVGLSK